MQEKTVEELISLIDIPLFENTLQNEQVTDSERKWLKFTLELMRWQQRFDIEIGEAPNHLPSGGFDIEIET